MEAPDLFRMLPCATTAVIGIIDDGSGSVPRISLACRERKRFGLCPTAGFLANGPVVPSTRLSNGQNGICRALRTSVSVRVRLRGASKTGDVRLFRDGQVSCKSRQTREEVGRAMVGQEQAGRTDKEICDLSSSALNSQQSPYPPSTPQC